MPWHSHTIHAALSLIESITTSANPIRVRIFCNPRIVWFSNPSTWSIRELTRSTLLRLA